MEDDNFGTLQGKWYKGCGRRHRIWLYFGRRTQDHKTLTLNKIYAYDKKHK
jgi:hypothetical protein